MWILFLLVLYWYYYSNSTCKKKTRKQAVSNESSWTMSDSLFFVELTNFHANKKNNHHLTIHHHLQQLDTFPANFLPFNLFFCFPKKSKTLFRLKEDKTWLRMFLKLIAWISLIVTRSKGRHLRFCRWIPSGPSGGFRVGVFLGVF